MANVHTARDAGGSLVHITFDRRGLVQLTERVTRETGRVAAASRKAHTALAKELQNDIAKVLEDRVEERGREQRKKRGNARLANAIRSKDNRKVDQTGYTVGYLDENPAVAPYYRNLEEGTDIFVGRFLKGVFRTAAGVPQVTFGPRGGRDAVLVEGGTDATFKQEAPWRSSGPYRPGMKVRNEIRGYHFFREGDAAFIRRGGTRSMAKDFYMRAFQDDGLALLLSSLQGPVRSGGTF